jgi:hypothetical protein
MWHHPLKIELIYAESTANLQYDPIFAKLIACKTKGWIVMIRWMLTDKGHDPYKDGMAKKLHPSKFTPRGKTWERSGIAAKVKKHVESGSPAEPPQSVAMERHWEPSWGFTL